MASSETIPEAGATAATRTLLFRVGPAVYGCDIDSVREIIPFRRATRLPGAPRYVHGLVNLRGTIVTVLDLGTRLEDDRAPVEDGSIVLAALGARTVGIAVDEVMDVQSIVAEAIDAGRPDAPHGLVRGLGRTDDGVVVLLDIQALVTQVLL